MTKNFYAVNIICQLSSRIGLWENRAVLDKHVKKMCRKYSKDKLKAWFNSQLSKQTLYIGGKEIKPHSCNRIYDGK